MKNNTITYRKARKLDFDKLVIDSLIYEQNDDGLLLECQVDSQGMITNKTYSLNFSEWNSICAQIEDRFIAQRLEDLFISLCLHGKSFISKLNVRDYFTQDVAIEEPYFTNRPLELRA